MFCTTVFDYSTYSMKTTDDGLHIICAILGLADVTIISVLCTLLTLFGCVIFRQMQRCCYVSLRAARPTNLFVAQALIAKDIDVRCSPCKNKRD